MIKKSFDISGHYTSISLEPEFWDALKQISQSTEHSIRQIVLKIDEERLKAPLSLKARSASSGDRQYPNLSSSIRVYILNYYRTATGHS